MQRDYFGDQGVVSDVADVEITGGFHVIVGMLDGDATDECNAILRGGQQTRTRLVAKGGARGQKTDVEQVTEIPMDYDRYRTAVVLRGIRSWDLREKGQIAPIDEAHVRRLLEKDRNRLFLKIEDLNAEIDEDQEGE